MLIEAEILARLRELDEDIQEFIPDGRVHRYGKQKHAWYIASNDVSKSGKPVYHVLYDSWKYQKPTQFSISEDGGNPGDKAQRDAYFAELRKVRQQQKLQDQQKASQAALKILAEIKATGISEYFTRKRIFGFDSCIGFLDGCVIIPMRDITGKLWGSQTITAKGQKYFQEGQKVKGCFASLGYQVDGTMFFCEGYATGRTIQDVMKMSTIVCFNAGNLKPVIEAYRIKYPTRDFIICADNDQWTEGNPGLTKARDIAKELNCKMVYPHFTNEDTKPTDFNDLYCLEGPEAVHAQIGNTVISGKLQFVTQTDISNKVFPPVKWVLPGYLPVGLSLLVGSPKIGKSLLALQLVQGVAFGLTTFFNPAMKIPHAKVIYFSLEDPERRTQARLAQQHGGVCPPTQNALYYYDTRLLKMAGGAEALRTALYEYPDCSLVIIDTLHHIRPDHNGKENKGVYTQDYEDMLILGQLSREFNICVMAIHHDRKAEATDYMDKISGTKGLTGAADTIWYLHRKRGKKNAILNITGRDLEEMELALELDNITCKWLIQGDSQEVNTSREEDELMLLFRKYPNQNLDIETVAGELDIEYRAAQVRLFRAKAKGRIASAGRGMYKISFESQIGKV